MLTIGYSNTVNPTRTIKMCSQKDDVEMHPKQQDRGRCSTLFWGKKCALSLRQTLQDEFLKDNMCVSQKIHQGFRKPL